MSSSAAALSALMDVIFCGNPGVGKSTLLTGISRVRFQSGVSWGSGLTNELSLVESEILPGVRFGDTPGLADMSLAEAAAQAITEAFRCSAAEGRRLLLFFVVTIESGRVRRDDLFTIKTVMSSIVMPDGSKPGPNSYGVIVNKCDFLDRPDFNSIGKPTLENLLGTQSKSVPFTTSYLYFAPLIPDLNMATNMDFEFEGLREHVLTFPGIEHIKDAEDIDMSDWEERLDKLAKQYHDDLTKLERTLREGHQAELAAMRKEMEATKKDMEEKLADAQRRASYMELAKTFTSVLADMASMGMQAYNCYHKSEKRRLLSSLRR